MSSFFRLERFIHSLKTAIACIIGIILTRLIDFPADQWIVVTIVVVMCAQIYVGSVVKNAYMRFLGTLTGCLFAMAVITTIGTNDISVAVTIGVSSFLFSFFAVGQENLSQAGTLGAVSTAIIMISQKPTVTLAAERFLEISIGLLIATLVSQFILPIHARKHLKREQARTLLKIKYYYENLIAKEQSKETAIKHLELDEEIVQSLLKQRQLAKESRREPLGSRFQTSHFLQSLYCEKNVLRAIVFMHHAIIQIKKLDFDLLSEPSVTDFNKKIIQCIEDLAKAINAKNPAKNSIDLPNLKEIILASRSHFEHMPRETSMYIDGYIFSAETLIQNLRKLARLQQIALLDDLENKESA